MLTNEQINRVILSIRKLLLDIGNLIDDRDNFYENIDDFYSPHWLDSIDDLLFHNGNLESDNFKTIERMLADAIDTSPIQSEPLIQGGSSRWSFKAGKNAKFWLENLRKELTVDA